MTNASHITLEPYPRRVVVRFAGEVIADSRSAVQLREGRYPPRLYFPRADVNMFHFKPSDHRTHCPFKGDATYYTLQAGGKTAEDAVWTYETPIAEVEGIAGLISFYPHSVQFEESD